MLRKRIVQKYIPDPNIIAIIGHDATRYSRLLFRNSIICGWLIVAYSLISYLWSHPYLSRSIAAVALVFFVKAVIDFLNLYLDGIVLTPSGISVFRREWLLQYSLENFDRPKVEMISFSQNTLTNRLFNTGDIVITLDYNISFEFESIPRPKQQTNLIMTTKYTYVQWWWDDDNSSETDQEKFDILVETLGEVIVDYMKDNKNKKNIWPTNTPKPDTTKERFL